MARDARTQVGPNNEPILCERGRDRLKSGRYGASSRGNAHDRAGGRPYALKHAYRAQCGDGLLQRVDPGFAGTDAHDVDQFGDKNLAVADFAGIRRLGDGLDDFIDLLVRDGHL